MFRGRVQLGEHIALGVLCLDASDTPTAPDAAPLLEIFSGTAKVLAKTIPALDRFGTTGLFQIQQFLDERFAAGQYKAIYRWDIGSYEGMAEDTFEVVAGGNADGQIIAMHYYKRPHADFIVSQLNSGKLVKGRNPRI